MGFFRGELTFDVVFIYKENIYSFLPRYLDYSGYYAGNNPDF